MLESTIEEHLSGPCKLDGVYVKRSRRHVELETI